MQALQGSASEHSYAQNSGAQNYGFHSLAKPRLSEALKHLVCKSLLTHAGGEAVYHIAVADLGCSHGRNTLDCAEFVVHELHENLASGEEHAHNIVDIQYFFSDLPSNDFNALFQSLQPYLHQSDCGIADLFPRFFAAGVPGSFYGRLFPTASLDLVICSYSLHWLSQVPPSLVDKASPAWNGGHTWVSKAKPSKAVADAYAGQSEMDVRSFLKNRAHELTGGGILFLFSLVRSPEEESVSAHHANGFIPFYDTLDVLDYAWKEMVDEGLIAAEEMDMFNMAWYLFNEQELERAVKDVPEMRVLHMETIKDMVTFPEAADWKETVEEWVGLLSGTIKPAVDAHVGKSKADELFKKILSIYLNQDCFNARLTTPVVVASLQRL